MHPQIPSPMNHSQHRDQGPRKRGIYLTTCPSKKVSAQYNPNMDPKTCQFAQWLEIVSGSLSPFSNCCKPVSFVLIGDKSNMRLLAVFSEGIMLQTRLHTETSTLLQRTQNGSFYVGGSPSTTCSAKDTRGPLRLVSSQRVCVCVHL